MMCRDCVACAIANSVGKSNRITMPPSRKDIHEKIESKIKPNAQKPTGEYLKNKKRRSSQYGDSWPFPMHFLARLANLMKRHI